MIIKKYKILFNILLICIIYNTLTCFDLYANNLNISNQSAYRGEEVTFELSLQDALNDVKSFGFDIEYSLSSLRFKPDDYEIGKLLEQGYGYFTLNEISPGLIRIGWFCMLDYKIPKYASGILAKLKFNVVGCNDSKIKIISLTDHIEYWPVENGQLKILENSFCLMDANGDDKIGIQEVIYLIKYLSED